VKSFHGLNCFPVSCACITFWTSPKTPWGRHPLAAAPSIMETSKKTLERNIDAFNTDVDQFGGYVYTSVDRWSTKYATSRQAEAVIDMLARNFPQPARIVDVGCGDGTFTVQMAERLGPSAIRGVEPAAKAVEAAQNRIPAHLLAKVSFEVGNIYDFTNKGEEVAVLRGVLHHLDRPQAAIAHLAQQFKAVMILEPNGYNPVMKLIEKTSTYHRQHDEKSYFPATLNRWFRSQGMAVVEQNYFCLVPYFCPTPAAKLLSMAEPALESLPIARQICCGTNLALYRS
jgi:2-polyprenyl-3-methyl-5-hydroxy-6-metoxy-1,4-benzoquinol methylase